MKKILTCAILIASASLACTYAADVTVDQLLDQILQGGTGAAITTTAQPVAVVATGAATGVQQPLAKSDAEFVSAVSWLYTNGITAYSTPDTFNPDKQLTREQAAKFFVVMQENVIGQVPVGSGTCVFKDTGFDSSLLPFVNKACGYAIMQGSQGMFRPKAFISKAEFMASLVRIVLGARLDETTTPWWLSYFQQAKEWGITKELNANALDVPITRYESALFLYRVIGAIQKASTGTGNQTPVVDVTGNTTSDGTTPDAVKSLVGDPILQEAIYRMYDLKMTSYMNIDDYRPFDTITRQDAAKIFTIFRGSIMDGTPSTSGSDCAFTDIDQADPTLTGYIQQACALQILKGSGGKFDPLGALTKPQAVAILVRMMEGTQPENTTPRWQGYYDRGVSLGMIQAASSAAFDKPITRYEIAMLLYNSNVKTQIVKNLNNDYETDKLIYPVPGTYTTNTGTSEISGLVSISTWILQRTDITNYVVDLFGTQYKLQKIATQKHLDNSYMWYGKLLTLDESTEIGTVAFLISNDVIINGVIRPYTLMQATYYIEPSTSWPYYNMLKKWSY